MPCLSFWAADGGRLAYCVASGFRETSVLERDRRFRTFVHHERREELRRLRLAGMGADTEASRAR
jgi:hypothetical protein